MWQGTKWQGTNWQGSKCSESECSRRTKGERLSSRLIRRLYSQFIFLYYLSYCNKYLWTQVILENKRGYFRLVFPVFFIKKRDFRRKRVKKKVRSKWISWLSVWRTESKFKSIDEELFVLQMYRKFFFRI